MSTLNVLIGTWGPLRLSRGAMPIFCFLFLSNVIWLYNSVQMFEPFQDRNPHFFQTVSLSWIVMKSISKTYSFNLFWTQPLRKKILGQNLEFWKSYFQFLRWNWFFRTNMESNAAVTLHFEDLAVQNYLFLKDVCICWWKISNCLQKHFWWLWNFSFSIFWRPSVTGCEKGNFYAFSHPIMCSLWNI